MNTHVVVVMHGADPVGARAAAGIQRQLCQAVGATVWLVRPEDHQLPTPSPWAGLDVQEVVEDNPATGFNGATELALQQGAKVIWLLRGDAVATAGWLAAQSQVFGGLVNWLAVGPAGDRLTGSQHAKIPAEVLERGMAEVAKYMAGDQGAVNFGRADQLDAAVIGFRSEAFSQVGPLDEQLPDLDWSVRQWFVRARAFNPVVVARGVYGTRFVNDPRTWPGGADEVVAAYLQQEARGRRPNPSVWSYVAPIPQSLPQLVLLRETIHAAAKHTDGVFLHLFGEPAEDGTIDEARVLRGFDSGPRDGLISADKRLLAAMKTDPGKGLRTWMKRLCKGTPFEVGVSPVPERPDLAEAAATNALRELGADWILMLREGEKLDNPQHLRRLLHHPDRAVRSFDVELAATFGSPTLVREDPPFGDGGTRLGDHPATRDFRLWRTSYRTRTGADGGRPCSLRVRNDVLLDPANVRPEVALDGMRLTQVAQDRSVGLFMLAHSGERLADVARWLDWSYGLTTCQVLVWTEDTPVPTPWRRVAQVFGVTIIRCPLADNFGAARNAGLEHVEASGARWAMFVDPDEWLDDPFDLLPVRRLAAANDVTAFTLAAENYRPDGARYHSSSFRFWRTGLGLRFQGRVHESIERSFVALRKAEPHRKATLGPIVLQNYGMATDEVRVEKHARYAALCALELEEDPHSVAHWLSLGWYYRARGADDQFDACLDRAVESSVGTEFLGYFERGRNHARSALGDMREALRRMEPGTPHYQTAVELLRALEGRVELDEARYPADELIPLPDYPGAPDAEDRH